MNQKAPAVIAAGAFSPGSGKLLLAVGGMLCYNKMNYADNTIVSALFS
jgi:hypothetical protein